MAKEKDWPEDQQTLLNAAVEAILAAENKVERAKVEIALEQDLRRIFPAVDAENQPFNAEATMQFRLLCFVIVFCIVM